MTPTPSLVDLQPFCGTDEMRPNLMKPFSRGEFTYAVNGHILVRVPRREDIAENPDAPDAERVLPKPPAKKFRALVSSLALPGLAEGECEECDGGTEPVHSCPNCECACEACDGKGFVSSDRRVSLLIGEIPFALQYARLLLGLPGIEVEKKIKPGKPMQFRFDGGIGILMPMSAPYPTHLSIDLAP